MPSEEERKIARVVGRRIRELRHERGWDQIDLEAHLDESVKRATLSDFETGRRIPSLKTVFRLAAAFEVEPATLLFNPGESYRHRVVIAVLESKPETLSHVAKLVDIARE